MIVVIGSIKSNVLHLRGGLKVIIVNSAFIGNGIRENCSSYVHLRKGKRIYVKGKGFMLKY